MTELTQLETERLTERIANHKLDVANLKAFVADKSQVDAAAAKVADLAAAIEAPTLGERITARQAHAIAAIALDTLECEVVDKTKLLAETEAELAGMIAQLSEAPQSTSPLAVAAPTLENRPANGAVVAGN
jgi:hypothetical protein